MPDPVLEERRVLCTYGTSESNQNQFSRLISSRPFIQQIDVLFPASEGLEAVLSALETTYFVGFSLLSPFVERAKQHVRDEMTVLALSALDEPTGDVWCIDQRAVLTLCVCTETYQKLGLVGTKLPFKSRIELHVPLRDHASPTRVDHALKAWDAARDQAGVGPWRVSCHLSSKENTEEPSCLTERVRAAPAVRRFTDINVPLVDIRAPPQDSEGLEDWDEGVHALFEWVGMACLGSQRLRSNDRVDPFIAVYEVPTPSRVGDVTHIRWRGFIPPSFLLSIMQSVGSHTSPFVAITAHAHPTSPVSMTVPRSASGVPYPSTLDDSTTTPGTNPQILPISLRTPPPLRVTFRAPRREAEDTWCVVLMPDELEEAAAVSDGRRTRRETRWVYAESVGARDQHFG